MKKIKWFFGILFVFATLLWSCNEDMLNLDENLDVPTLKSTTAILLADGTSVDACGTESVTLWAGQTINAGTVVVSNDATNLYVTITSTAGFQQVADNIKMWVGTDMGLLDGGGVTRPAGGKLPYKVTVTTETSYTFTIPLQNVPGYNAETCGQQTIFVVIHGDVLAPDGNGGTTEETAFGGDKTGSGSAWWFYNEYVPSCCVTTPPVITTNLETAFAHGTHVFVTPLYNKKTGLIDYKNNPEQLQYLSLTQNRWGWANNLETTVNDFICPVSTYYLNYYQSLGFRKGGYYVNVGTVEVTNDADNLYFKILPITGWSLTQPFSGNTISIYVWSADTYTPQSGALIQLPYSAITSQPYTVVVPVSSVPNIILGNQVSVRLMPCMGSGGWNTIPFMATDISSAPNYVRVNTFAPTPVESNLELPIYAGAGLNNLGNGTLVGKAIISYNGTSLSVKYDLDEGYEMEEVHVYANDAAPLKVAPGQFEFVQYFDPMVNDFETVFDVPDTNGDGKIWVILHSVVDLNTN